MAETTTNPPPTVTADAAIAKDSAASAPRHDETTLEALASYCAVIVVGLFILTFIFQNFVIPSGSMEKTLLIGDHVLVDRVNLAPPAHWAPFVRYRTVHRGDIIVFLKPGYPDMFLVKRVVGIPGDRVHLHEGYVYLNGQRQDEPQAGHPDYSSYLPYRDEFPNVPTSQGQDIEPVWANDSPRPHPERRPGSAPWQLLRHGRQPVEQSRWPLLGFCAPRKHRRTSPLRLLVVHLARRR